MAKGLPVIVTDVRGAIEALGGTGKVIPQISSN
jgi:hypothetical protein